MKNDTVTALEITPKYLKLLHANIQKGKCSVLHSIVRSLESDGTKDIAGVLRETISSHKIPASSVSVIIPRHQVIQKVMHLPAQNDAEIRDMLNLQIPQHVPFAREEIIFDYLLLEKEGSGYAKVLVYVCAREIIKKVLDVIEAAKLEFDSLSLSSAGIRGWWRQLKSFKDNFSEVSLLVNMEDSHVELCFFHEGRLLFSRDIFLGFCDLEQGGGSGIIKQMGLTLRSFQNDFNAFHVTKVFLVENSPRTALLSDALEGFYKLPVERLAPFAAVGASLSETGDRAGLRSTVEASLIELLGFVMNDGGSSVSFVPTDVVASKRAAVHKKAYLKTLILFIVAVTLGVSVLGINIYRKQSYFDIVQEELAQFKQEIKEAERKIEFIRFAETLSQKKIFIADIFKELYQITPEDIMFRSLVINQKGKFLIEGYAVEGMSVNSFQNSLVNSKMFSGVSLQFATKRKRLKKEYTEFKISCQLAE
ncbi:MAG: pilus assembly protein PilM [Candidatus Omnitrophica bacterium]|nr:pilus assembly protein PilM [Candidatus Omnitrophota bacterium]